MSQLHILDAGRADCTVLLLDTPQGQQTVVVDGGGKYHGSRRPLLEFLTRRKITSIDLLILTHLHQDHFGGFVHLVDQVQVRRAVAPCGDLRFADRVYPVFGDPEFYREYHTFFAYLERSGTELIRAGDCADRTFSFGDYCLECLYPLQSSTLRSVDYAQALCDPALTEEPWRGIWRPISKPATKTAASGCCARAAPIWPCCPATAQMKPCGPHCADGRSTPGFRSCPTMESVPGIFQNTYKNSSNLKF